MKKLAAIVFATTLLLAGCGDSDDPEPKPSESAATQSQEPNGGVASNLVEIEIADGKVSPQGGRVEVKVGEKVTLSVTSDAADEIHVHSEPEHSLDVAPGDKGKQLTFTLEAPGQVAVESHELDATIVQLVVTP